MISHLSGDRLIRYMFQLDDARETQAVTEHLEGCAACRSQLEQLRVKFSHLDLLKDEPTVSEALITRTVANVDTPPISRSVPFLRWVWLTSAAAIVLASGLLIYFLIPPPSRPAQVVERTSTTVNTPFQKPAEARGPAIPPFAPASHIELVTLPRREKVQITIYNSANLTFVRETRNLTMKAGWNWLQFMWANSLIDPTSLSLEPKAQADRIHIKQLVFPPRLKEVARWLIRSEVSGQVPFEITYFTSGVSWRAFYLGTLAPDESTMKLESYVRVANQSGEDYENTQVRLIVGTLHTLNQIAALASRELPYDRPGEVSEKKIIRDFAGFDIRRRGGRLGDEKGGGVPMGEDIIDGLYYSFERPKEIVKEGLSEYFLYTIEGTETIPSGWAKRLPSFEAEDIPARCLYKYDEERYGSTAHRFVSFANDEKHHLGHTPLPNGEIKIYRTVDPEKHLSYLGGTNVKYIPVNEKVEMDLGAARDVKIKPRLMDIRTENYLLNDQGNIAGWDELRTWKFTVDNTRGLPAEIEITRGFGTPYWSLTTESGAVNYRKHDATHGRFTLRVSPRVKVEFTYTLRTYHGKRQELRGQ
jgi:hypothetical protein